MPHAYNGVRNNATKRHVRDLLLSVHGCSNGLGTWAPSRKRVRSGWTLRHGNHGSPQYYNSGLSVHISD